LAILMVTVVIGAGIGGLTAAIALAAKGEAVTVIEAQAGAGGKLLPVRIDGQQFDSGPTVLTMRWVFDEVFKIAGDDFSRALNLKPLSTLARHYWSGSARLDLFADPAESAAAIGRFAGKAEAQNYVAFSAKAKQIHNALLEPFLKSQRPSLWGLTRAMPLGETLRINPFETYWKALRRYFKDPRLRQMFGRYATYCGTSPFQAPATLMLVADVEAQGVWRVEGGMAALAAALETLAKKLGVTFHFNSAVERIETSNGSIAAVIDQNKVRHACQSIVCNADAAALAAGLFGSTVMSGDRLSAEKRSLSAITWNVRAAPQGVPLDHHNVFFSDDYEREFSDLQHSPARDPTVYMCDQGDDRKLLLINAPANNLTAPQDVERRTQERLSKCGLSLTLENQNIMRRSPQDFAQLYPATQGALYGRASNGWMSTFQRPSARSKIPGLYLAGGSTHPGPGVPMAALAGLRAAEALLADRALTRRS
jgi:1-hydroxycarotenoid 3,4-desaturase